MNIRKLLILLLLIIFQLTCNKVVGNSVDGILTMSFEELKEILPNTNSPDSLSRIYYALAKQYLKRDIGNSLVLFDKSLDYAVQIEDANFAIQIKKSKSLAYINLQEFEKAEQLLGEASDFYKEQKDSSRYASSLNFYAYIYSEKNEYDEALKYGFKAREVFENINDKIEIQNVTNRIGIIYQKMGNYQKALEYYEEIIATGRSTKIRNMYRAALNNAGGVHMKLGNYEKAEEYIRESFELRKRENNAKNIAYGYENLADLESLRHNYDEALRYLDSSLHLFYEVDYRGGIAEILIKKAVLLLEMGKHKDHKQAVIEAYEKMQEWEISTNEEMILHAYADILFEEGDTRYAYSLLKKAIQLEKDKNSEERILEIKKLESQLESQKEESEMESMAKKIEIQELSISKKSLRQKYLMTILGLGSALILLLLLSNKLRKGKNKLLESKNGEISKSLDEREVLIKEIHHRVKNNLQIVSSILSLQSRTIKDEGVKEAIVDSRDRVKSMALIHQKLYQEDNLKGVDMKDYLNTLGESLGHSYNIEQKRITIDFEIDPIILDIDSSIPIGLIVNELITNALKYAFDSMKKGTIVVTLREINQKLLLEVSDNGEIIRSHTKLEEGFGFQLIRSLSRKLYGELKTEISNGLTVQLEIKNYKKIS